MAHFDQLHQLIHSLSKTEKKYFKEQSNGQNYVLLFDAINAQDEYDEEKLKKKFKDKAFINNFSAAKTYLQDAILRALRNFNSGKLMDDVSYERLQNLKLFLEKGMISVVEKQLPRLKQFCYDYDQYSRLLEVLTFEAMYNSAQIISNGPVFEERTRVIKILSNVNELNIIYAQLIGKAANQGHGTAADSAELEAIMRKPILKEEALCGVSDELYALWNVFFVYNYRIGNFRESYFAKKKQYMLVSQNDMLLKTRPKTYLLLVGNMVSMAFNVSDLAEFEYCYTEMEKAHQKVQGFEGLKFEQRSNFGLLLFKLRGEYSGLVNHVKYIEENIGKHKDDVTLVREMDMYFNVAIAFFRKKDFSTAIDWLNRILNHERIEERLQISRHARHLELLVHYELGNVDLLDYKITNTQRFLTKRKLGDEFDKVLIQGFRRLIKAGSKKDIQLALTEMKADLMGMAASENAHAVNGQFEYLKWLEEKIK